MIKDLQNIVAKYLNPWDLTVLKNTNTCTILEDTLNSDILWESQLDLWTNKYPEYMNNIEMFEYEMDQDLYIYALFVTCDVLFKLWQ